MDRPQVWAKLTKANNKNKMKKLILLAFVGVKPLLVFHKIKDKDAFAGVFSPANRRGKNKYICW